MGLIGVGFERLGESRQARDALGAHRVAFVRHGRRSDLFRFERLVDLAKRLEEPDVATELRRAGRNPGHDGEDTGVELPRVRLAGDGQCAVESKGVCHPAVELAHLVVVTVEQLEIAALRPGGALDAAEGQGGPAVIQIREIEEQVLHPERRAFPHRRELGRLQVRVPECGLGPPLPRERRQRPEDPDDATTEDLESRPKLDQVGVIGDVGARRTQVDDPPGGRRDISEGVHVRHDVVAKPLLVAGDGREVDVVEVSAHVVDRGLRHVGSQRALRFGEREPDPAPPSVPRLGRPERHHLGRRVSLGQWGGVARLAVCRRRAARWRAH